MNWRLYLTIMVVTALVSTSATWKVQSWRWQAELADVAAAHQANIKTKEETIQAMKGEATRQLQTQQIKQREQAERIATLDAKHYKELRRAQTENTRLRTDLTAGRRRLYVDTAPAASSASGNPVPGNASTARLDDGTVRRELHPATAGLLVGIAGDADECARKLIGLQELITTQRTDK